jgi:glycosyltransferase involved in cell wall biosynthesis
LLLSFNQEINSASEIVLSERVIIKFFPLGKYKSSALNYFFNSSKIIKKHVRIFRPDIVHYELGGAFLLSRIGLKAKCIAQTIHGIIFSEGKIQTGIKVKGTYLLNGIIERLLLPKNIIHISQYSSRLFNNKNQDTTRIIPNAVAGYHFTEAVKTTTSNRLLYVGVIDKRKNLLFLLKALTALVEQGKVFTLDVLGGYKDTEYELEVNRFVEKHELSNYVKFWGWVPQSALPKFIQHTDILVMPSLQETLPMTIAEAMAAGKVVVASSVGGIPEMICDQYDGFLFDVLNVDSLTTVLQGLYNNHERVTLVSERAKKAALKYHFGIVAKQTVEFYKQIA